MDDDDTNPHHHGHAIEAELVEPVDFTADTEPPVADDMGADPVLPPSFFRAGDSMSLVRSPHTGDKRGRSGRNGTPISLVVIHTMENPESHVSAENNATWFANPASHLSSHYGVDDDSVIQHVNEADQAWHTPGALNGKFINEMSIGIELAGSAKRTPEQWGNEFSRAELAAAAALTAEVCVRYNIPIQHCTSAMLVAGEKGITGHNEANQASEPGKAGHYDPGPNFPWPEFIAMVKAFADSQGPATPSRNPFPAAAPAAPAAPPAMPTPGQVAEALRAKLEAAQHQAQVDAARLSAAAPSGMTVGKGVLIAAGAVGAAWIGWSLFEVWKKRQQEKKEAAATERPVHTESSVPAWMQFRRHHEFA